jgi:hypothetical protein
VPCSGQVAVPWSPASRATLRPGQGERQAGDLSLAHLGRQGALSTFRKDKTHLGCHDCSLPSGEPLCVPGMGHLAVMGVTPHKHQAVRARAAPLSDLGQVPSPLRPRFPSSERGCPTHHTLQPEWWPGASRPLLSTRVLRPPTGTGNCLILLQLPAQTSHPGDTSPSPAQLLF